MTDVAIIGIGATRFGRQPGVSGRAMGAAAARAALVDAGLSWNQMQFAFGGSDSCGNADALVADLGLTGIEFVNVTNGCATGGAALAMADRAIRSGAYDVGIALGFDKHEPGAFNAPPEQYGLDPWYGQTGLMMTTQFFGLKVQRYLHDYDLDPSILASISAKAFRNGALNPNAWRRSPLTVEEINAARMVSHPLTQYMFCSPGEGAVALVLCRADKARDYTSDPIRLASVAMRSRSYGTFEVFSPSLSVARTDGPTVAASRAAMDQAGIEPTDIDVAQIQDTEAGAELMHMAECGLCEHGEQQRLIEAGATEISGSLPINTDGGCLANGEPIGASGLRQVYEVTTQLRGRAGDRQVGGTPRVGFTHVYGAPGVSACTVLTK